MAIKMVEVVTFLVPIAIHAIGCSVVDLLADQRPTSESMVPDTASLIFFTATSIAATKWLQQNPIRLLGTDGIKSFIVVMTSILSNIIICDLSLRLLWIPLQYFLRYLRKEKIMAFVVSRVFFFLHFFNLTRDILNLWIQADLDFVFNQNFVAAGYLFGTLWYMNYFAGVKRLFEKRNKRFVDAINPQRR